MILSSVYSMHYTWVNFVGSLSSRIPEYLNLFYQKEPAADVTLYQMHRHRCEGPLLLQKAPLQIAANWTASKGQLHLQSSLSRCTSL